MIMFLASLNLFANNITISNVTLTGKNTTSHFTLVQFDLSWENSWQTSSDPNRSTKSGSFTNGPWKSGATIPLSISSEKLRN